MTAPFLSSAGILGARQSADDSRRADLRNGRNRHELTPFSSNRVGTELRPPTPYVRGGIGRSWRIIQLSPNRSRSWPNREAKNVSSIGIKTSPPSQSAEKMRSASASLSTLSDR